MWILKTSYRCSDDFGTFGFHRTAYTPSIRDKGMATHRLLCQRDDFYTPPTTPKMETLMGKSFRDRKWKAYVRVFSFKSKLYLYAFYRLKNSLVTTLCRRHGGHFFSAFSQLYLVLLSKEGVVYTLALELETVCVEVLRVDRYLMVHLANQLVVGSVNPCAEELLPVLLQPKQERADVLRGVSS